MTDPVGSTPDRRVVAIARAECLQLLGANRIGRLVVTTPSAHIPIIRPVNYVFDAAIQSIVFRTAPGSKFHALVRSARAWFEIDYFDERAHSGWSVIVEGVSEEVSQSTEIRRLAGLGVAPWAPGEKPHWVRIRARTISGRRILPNSPPTERPLGGDELAPGTRASAPSL